MQVGKVVRSSAENTIQYLRTTPISELTALGYAKFLNVKAAQDPEVANALLGKGLRGKVTPKFLKSMPTYVDNFTPSGNLTEMHSNQIVATLEERELPKDTSILDYFRIIG